MGRAPWRIRSGPGPSPSHRRASGTCRAAAPVYRRAARRSRGHQRSWPYPRGIPTSRRPTRSLSEPAATYHRDTRQSGCDQHEAGCAGRDAPVGLQEVEDEQRGVRDQLAQERRQCQQEQPVSVRRSNDGAPGAGEPAGGASYFESPALGGCAEGPPPVAVAAPRAREPPPADAERLEHSSVEDAAEADPQRRVHGEEADRSHASRPAAPRPRASTRPRSRRSGTIAPRTDRDVGADGRAVPSHPLRSCSRPPIR